MINLKKFSIIAIYIVFCGLVSCAFDGREETNTPVPIAGEYEYDGGNWSSMEYKIEERVIDSCEYIIVFGVDGRDIIHKANCNNPFH